MKPRRVNYLQLAGWVASWIFSAWSSLPVATAETLSAVGANDQEKTETKAEEDAEIKEDEETSEKTPAPAVPATEWSPIEDFAPVVPTADVPLTEFPERIPGEDVPDTFPVVIPSEDPLAFTTPEAEQESEMVVDDLAAPWPPVPGGLFGQPASGFGNNGGFAVAPSGFHSAAPSFSMGGFGRSGLLEGFHLSTNLSGTYSTNVNGSGGTSNEAQDDYIFALGGGLSYMSKAKEWTFGGSYSGSYNQYLKDADLSGYNQGLGLVGQYTGGKLTGSLNLSGGVEEGTNRYYDSDFVQQTSLNVGVNLNYQYSPKTSFQGNYSQSFTLTGGDEYNNTDSSNLGISALWKYSKRTSFGPGMHCTFQSSGGENARTSISPDFLINYILDAKVSLNSRIGVDFSQYEGGGGGDPSLNGSINLNYNASKLWGMNLSLNSGTQPDASASGSYTQFSSLNIGYHRRLRQASLGLGLGYEINTTQSADNANTSGQSDGNFLNMNASLGMPVFANTCSASLFLQYGDQFGGSEDSGDSMQIGFSISRSF